MKNRLIALFFFAIMFLGTSSFTFEQGGTIIAIWPKNSNTQYIFSFPPKYLDKEGKLTLPIEIELEFNGKKPIKLISNQLTIVLPALDYSGTGSITVQIGDYCARRMLR